MQLPDEVTKIVRVCTHCGVDTGSQTLCPDCKTAPQRKAMCEANKAHFDTKGVKGFFCKHHPAIWTPSQTNPS